MRRVLSVTTVCALVFATTACRTTGEDDSSSPRSASKGVIAECFTSKPVGTRCDDLNRIVVTETEDGAIARLISNTPAAWLGEESQDWDRWEFRGSNAEGGRIVLSIDPRSAISPTSAPPQGSCGTHNDSETRWWAGELEYKATADAAATELRDIACRFPD